jgi:hypothetical protein
VDTQDRFYNEILDSKNIVNHHGCTIKDHWEMDLHAKLNQGLLSILYKPISFASNYATYLINGKTVRFHSSSDLQITDITATAKSLAHQIWAKI